MSTDAETLAAPTADDLAAEARGFFDLDAPPAPLPPPAATGGSWHTPIGAPVPTRSGPSLPSPNAPLTHPPTAPASHPATHPPVALSTPTPLTAPSNHPPTRPPAGVSGYTALDPLTSPTTGAATTPVTGPRRRGRGRRVLSWLFALALLAGLGVAGVRYGPGLFELATSEPDPSTTVPLRFPVPTAPLEPVRTAAISVHRTDSSGELVRYDATVDFESGVAQAFVDRGDLPALEIRAVFNDAVVRRVDQQVWYRMARGGFPFDGAGRDAWVRTLDQVLPAQVRGATTIVEATDAPFGEITAGDVAGAGGNGGDGDGGRSETSPQLAPPEIASEIAPGSPVAPETMRRIVLDVDQQQIAGLYGATASDPAAPALTLPIGTPHPDQLVRGDPVQLEMWVDRSGVVRHVATDGALGNESFTIHSMSAEPWVTWFPDEADVRQMTAQAMLELNI